MKTVSDLITESIVNFAVSPKNQENEDFKEGVPVTAKATPKGKRVEGSELELAYTQDPIIFNGINKALQAIMTVNNEFVGGAKGAKEELEEFFYNQIGNVGLNNTYDDWLEDSFKSYMLSGKTWEQFIFNKKGNMIVDIDCVDFKTMDYARDGSKNIVFDIYGRPYGYAQKIPINETIPAYLNKFKEPPKDSGVTLTENQIFIPKERIALLKYIGTGDKFQPYGLIETIYKSSLRKLNIKEAQANSIYTVGFPVKVGYVGDEKHNPTPASIENLLNKMTQLDNKGNMVVPFWEKVEILEPTRNIDAPKELMDGFEQDEFTGLGMPRPFVTGEGISGKGASFDVIAEMYNLTLNHIAKKLASELRKNVFMKILKTNFNKYAKIKLQDVPQLKFDLIGVGAVNAQTDRLKKLTKAGVITEEDKDVKEKILKREGLRK